MNIARREEAYRFFLADGIKILTENTAGKTGTALLSDVRDIVYPKPKTDDEEYAESIKEKSCEEIVRDMWTRPTPKKGG